MLLQTWKSLRNDPEGRFLAESLERWVEEPLPLDGENTSEGPTQAEYETDESDTDMPIWKAAQQALPRYEAVLSSVGSRGLLLRRILVRMGLLPSDSISPPVADEDPTAVEPHLRYESYLHLMSDYSYSLYLDRSFQAQWLIRTCAHSRIIRS